MYDDYPPIDCPAHVVYSPDAAVDDNPNLLQCVANAVTLYKDVSLDEVPKKIRPFVEVVQDERARQGVKQNFSFEDGTEIMVYLKAMIVFRKYLPDRKITSELHPILANIGEKESIITLPEKYWTRKIKKYTKGKNKRCKRKSF